MSAGRSLREIGYSLNHWLHSPFWLLLLGGHGSGVYRVLGIFALLASQRDCKQPVKIKLVIIVKVSILITLHNIKTKIKLQSSFAHLHVVANLYDLLSSVKPQSNFLKMSPVFHLSIQWKSVKLFEPHWPKQWQHPSKYLFVCSTEESKSYRWVNDDIHCCSNVWDQ